MGDGIPTITRHSPRRCLLSRNEYGAVVLNFARKIRGLISTNRRQLSEAFAYENNHLLISRVPLSVGC
jgi:hypothetical protein